MISEKKTKRNIYAAKYREEHREEYNKYANDWYKKNREKQREYIKEWRRKRKEWAREQGIVNVSGYVEHGQEPRYRNGEE